MTSNFGKFIENRHSIEKVRGEKNDDETNELVSTIMIMDTLGHKYIKVRHISNFISVKASAKKSDTHPFFHLIPDEEYTEYTLLTTSLFIISKTY